MAVACWRVTSYLGGIRISRADIMSRRLVTNSRGETHRIGRSRPDMVGSGGGWKGSWWWWRAVVSGGNVHGQTAFGGGNYAQATAVTPPVDAELLGGVDQATGFGPSAAPPEAEVVGPLSGKRLDPIGGNTATAA